MVGPAFARKLSASATIHSIQWGAAQAVGAAQLRRDGQPGLDRRERGEQSVD
jgi:hypothetical protein